MILQDIINIIESVAPLSYQEDWDNSGLQVGDRNAEVNAALLTVDVTESVVDEAIALGCDLIVSHHPLLFRGLKQITGSTPQERCVLKAIQHNIAIYSAHTSMDSWLHGVSGRIAEKLGVQNYRILVESQDNVGLGVIGQLAEPMDKEDFIALVKEVFDAGCVRFNSWTGEKVGRVALCGGAGAFLMSKAVAAGADAFLTGEMHYHQCFGHDGQIQIGVLGHYQSEQYTMDIFNSVISERCPRLPLFKTTVCTNPIKYL